MAIFVGVHTMGSPMSEDQMKQAWESYKAACAKAGLTPKHTHLNAKEGRGFCVTEASSAGEIKKAHDDAGVPVNEVIEVVDFN